ncbi:hypothetical protein AAF712_011094 [Marasmius tenuissimus]|uniref:Uncharacterized protein n=1 Tax=Marasmius tenuissimus TaxID=585030 RepID=A0ABR2ZK09_9AGAR|nr:hypothetical protein PM082_011042 [Marasmius tenuissimus]KAJ8094298.1 hypothetical protein PM082_006838 [Marasmius tenuissimus]
MTGFEPCEDDTNATRAPIDEAYAEYTYLVGRELEIFYFRQKDSRPSLEDLGERVYAGWINLWPHPMFLEKVRLEAKNDWQKAITILKKNLIKDSLAAVPEYRQKVQDGLDLPSFTLPESVKAGYATWDKAMDNVINEGQWRRWASKEYLKAVKTLKRADEAKAAVHLNAWMIPMMAQSIEEASRKMNDVMGHANMTYDKALEEFMAGSYSL